MKAFFVFIEIVAALGVIGTVLMHSAKGEGMGAIGGQARIFGTPKGLEEGLDKLTIGCAVAFMVSAIIVAAS